MRPGAWRLQPTSLSQCFRPLLSILVVMAHINSIQEWNMPFSTSRAHPEGLASSTKGPCAAPVYHVVEKIRRLNPNKRLDLAANRADPSQKSDVVRSLSKDFLQELQEELFWETCEDKCESQNLLARPSPTFIARSRNRQDRVLAPPPWLVPVLSGC